MPNCRDRAVKSVYSACALLSQVVTIDSDDPFEVSPANAATTSLLDLGIVDAEDFRQQLITLLPNQMQKCIGEMPLTTNSQPQDIIDFVEGCCLQTLT